MMLSTSDYIIIIILLLPAFSLTSSAEEQIIINSISYFPINVGTKMVYESSIGKSTTEYFQDGEYAVSSSEADDFKYRQIMILKDDGIYVKEIYQYFKIFLFINKEATFTYAQPLLRFPLPLFPGKEWKWVGDEYSDGDTNKVIVTGKAINKEYVITKAGRFEVIKLETVIEGSSSSKNRVTEWYAEDIGLIKAQIIIEGGGIMGFLRDLLGYSTIEFELEEIKRQ